MGKSDIWKELLKCPSTHLSNLLEEERLSIDVSPLLVSWVLDYLIQRHQCNVDGLLLLVFRELFEISIDDLCNSGLLRFSQVFLNQTIFLIRH